MAKKKKHAPPPPPPFKKKKKKKHPAPHHRREESSIEPALLNQAVARIRGTRLGLDPHARKHLGRDLGRRYILEHSEGYQLKNILEADEADRLHGHLDEVEQAIDPLKVAKTGLGKWIRGLLPETIDPLDERLAAGVIEGLRDTAEVVAAQLQLPPEEQPEPEAEAEAPPKPDEEE